MTSNRSSILDWSDVPPDFAERFAERVDGLLLDEARAIGRLLDWVGVAEMSPQRERVLYLCAEYLSRTGQLDVETALRFGREVVS
jgi:hypothetical protein